MIDVEKISKDYGRARVVNDLSFSIARGEVVGLAGPNGSGKTTLLNIMMGMVRPTSGNIKISKETKLGMAVSRKGFFNDMTVERNLLMYAGLAGVKRPAVEQAMTEFLIDFRNARFGELSAGMKQRVALVLPFLTHYDLVLLDEPSNHLDIDSIIILRNKILSLSREGVAFLITSHIFSDLEKVCSRILLLQSGKLITDRRTEDLVQEFGSLEGAYLGVKQLVS
jgi:ABC-2 type transport system ATP-binding protein